MGSALVGSQRLTFCTHTCPLSPASARGFSLRMGGPTSWRPAKVRSTAPKHVSAKNTPQAARDPHIKQQLLEIAEKWRTMAAYEEKFER
jgi:hypothetical protein